MSKKLTLAAATKALTTAEVDAQQNMLLHSQPVPARGAMVAGAFVLRYIHSSPHPYVTHFRRDDDGSFHQGGYHGDLGAAVDDFNRRLARELGVSVADL